MPVRLKNNARALLAVSISEIDPFIRVRVGKGERFPQLGLNDWFPLALEDDQGNVEITRAVARAGDVLTVLRGQEGTTARAFSAGALVSLRLTAEASRAFLTGEDDPDDGDDQDGDADPELTAPRGLIFNGLIVNAYHDELGRQGYFHPYSGTSEGQYVFAGACYQAAQVISDYLEEVDEIPTLAVTGTLPDGSVGNAYEGRLTISNAVGSCTVRQTGGDTLPAGSVIRVDQETMEVVVEWPAYVAVAPQLDNPGFEDGDTSGWDITQFGGVGTPSASTERPKEGLYSGRWIGASGVGHAGGVEAVWENETDGEVIPGQSVTASAWIALKDTGSSQNRGRVRLHWYDEDGHQLPVRPQDMGTLIRGNNSAWRLSTVTARAPAGAVRARLAVWTTANNSANSGVLIDAATWNVPASTGTGTVSTLCIELRVTDQRPSDADWSGCVSITTGLWHFHSSNASLRVAVGPYANPATYGTAGLAANNTNFLMRYGSDLYATGNGSNDIYRSTDGGFNYSLLSTADIVSAYGGMLAHDGTYFLLTGGVHAMQRSLTAAPGSWAAAPPGNASRASTIIALGSRVVYASGYQQTPKYSDNSCTTVTNSTGAGLDYPTSGYPAFFESGGILVYMYKSSATGNPTRLFWSDNLGTSFVNTGYTFPNDAGTGGPAVSKGAVWVAVSGTGHVATSPDGKVWATSPATLPAGQWAADSDGAIMVFRNGVTGGIYSTTDGITFTALTGHPMWGITQASMAGAIKYIPMA